MDDPQALRQVCLQAVHAAGLRPVGELFHRFPGPGGVTGAVLLAESHLALHTWPEHGTVTIDVFVCNFLQDQLCFDGIQIPSRSNCIYNSSV